MLFATAANAQTVVLGAGSSALFPTVGIAAVTPDPISGGGAPCGTHLWTGKNGSVSAVVNGIDPRGGTTPEPGNIWVAWDTTRPTVVCAYLAVDSLVGQRLMFAQGISGGVCNVGNGTLQFTSGTASGNLIGGFPDTDATVPATVAAAINGTHFNVAFTDIRPEDGQFAYFRAANSTASGGFGYNPTGLVAGQAILSSFSNTNAQVDSFHISGSDPISTCAIPSSTTTPLGASPIVLFYRTNGTVGSVPTNVLSKTATKFFSGQIGSSQQVFGTSQNGVAVPNAVMSQIQREPLSGTYNTFEFQIVHARDGNSGDTQECASFCGSTIAPTPAACFVGGTPFVACTNPMYINSGTNSQRYRAIGTGEMVKAVNGTTTVPTTNPDAMGYAFYSLGTFFISGSHLKYVTLQGVDGLYSNYDTSGLFGTCAGSIPGGTFQCTTKLPSFPHVQDGSYRVWSSLRAITNTSAPLPPALATTLFHAAQDQAAFALNNPASGGISCSACVISAIADFVPNFSYPGGVQTAFLKVFRSHYPISGVAANNGTNPPNTFCAADQASPNCFEEGGDMAGVPFYINTDVTYFNIFGGEWLTQIE